MVQEDKQQKEKKVAWAKKQYTKQETKTIFGYFRFHAPCRCEVNERRVDGFYMCFPPKHWGGDVIVGGCFAGDNVGDLFKIEGKINQHGYHSIPQWPVIPSDAFSGTIVCFSTTGLGSYTSRLCKGSLSKKKNHVVPDQMTWSPESPWPNLTEMDWDELVCRGQSSQQASNLWVSQWSEMQSSFKEGCWHLCSKENRITIQSGYVHTDEYIFKV